MHDKVKHDGTSQESFTQQLTVPPTSLRRPVFFNQTHRQFVMFQSHEVSHCLDTPRDRCNTIFSDDQINHITFPTGRSGPLHHAFRSNPNSCLQSYLTLGLSEGGQGGFLHIFLLEEEEKLSKWPEQPSDVPFYCCRTNVKNVVWHQEHAH